jgi:hypothetical protein
MTKDATQEELGIGPDRKSVSYKRFGIVDPVRVSETRVDQKANLCELKARMQSCGPVSAAGEVNVPVPLPRLRVQGLRLAVD